MKSYADFFIRLFLIALGMAYLLADTINLLSPPFHPSKFDHYFLALSVTGIGIILKVVKDLKTRKRTTSELDV